MAFVFEEYSKGAPSTGHEDDELIVLVNDGSPDGVRTVYTYLIDAGLQMYVNTYPVDTLPDTLEPSILTFGGTINLYVLKSTGIVYADGGDGAMPVGLVIFGYDGYDKGYVSEVPEILDVGIFVMRKSDIFKDGNYTFHLENEIGQDTVTLSPLDWVKVQADFENTSIHFRYNETFEGLAMFKDFVLTPTANYFQYYEYGGIFFFGNTPQAVGVYITGGVAWFKLYGLKTL